LGVGVSVPSGTVTFLFSDVEGSTRLWDTHGEEMRAALAVHDEIVRGALESAGGLVFTTRADGFGAAFSKAGWAIAAALAAQRGLAAQEWPWTGGSPSLWAPVVG
jgi:class 3 adenylate cyclase